jgi:amino acid transporter
MANKLRTIKEGTGDDGLIKGAGPGCLIYFIIVLILFGIAYIARQSSGLLHYLAWSFLVLITLVWLIDKIMTVRDRLKK